MLMRAVVLRHHRGNVIVSVSVDEDNEDLLRHIHQSIVGLFSPKKPIHEDLDRESIEDILRRIAECN